MKLRTVFAALTALACGALLGAEPPASPSATPIKHNSLKACNKQADSKRLTGTARTQFLKSCQAGKGA